MLKMIIKDLKEKLGKKFFLYFLVFYFLFF